MSKIKPIHLKIFSNAFILVSLVFVVRYLISNDLLGLPDQINWYWLLASLALLILGFLADCISWRIILKNNKIVISWKDSILSLGMSVFGKYIPGKIWLITGISSKVASITGESVIKISMLATVVQVLTILMGFVVGAIGLKPFMDIRLIVLIYILAGLFAGLFLLFQKKVCASNFVQKYKLTREFVSPLVRSISLQLLIWIIVTWVLWSVSFYLLAVSLGFSMDLAGAFVLPLGLSVGIIVLIAPGGLGVREGVLSLLLSGFLTSRQEIVTLAAFSRVWFLSGEVFLFLLAVLLTLTNRRKLVGMEHNAGPIFSAQ